MNIREFNGYQLRFIDKTYVDLWDAIEEHALWLWFFFENYEELIEYADTNEKEFISLYSTLEKIYSKKRYNVTEKRVIYAIAVSLFNTHAQCTRRRIEDSYISNLFIEESRAKEVLTSYWDLMSNPLAFIVNPEKMYKSLIVWRHLNQLPTFVDNWKYQGPRANWYFARKQMHNLLDIDSINLDDYHPTVWYLLSEKKILEYQSIFPNALALCEKRISNSIQRQQKIIDE